MRSFGAVLRDPVGSSEDLDRILALPRRAPVDLTSTRAIALVELMTERLRRPDRPVGAACGCAAMGRRRCIDRLLPAQAWALWEARLANGLLGQIFVGGGKSLLDLLVATVIPNCKIAALLVPPGLVGQLVTEYKFIAEHFVTPSLILPIGFDGSTIRPGQPAVHVLPYSRFSRAEATELLENLRPDTVIADEVYNLKCRTAARTIRALRYFANHPETRLCAWSGTLTARSIKDFAHIAAFSLGTGSPLPLEPSEVEKWASALDPSDWPAPAGALRRLAASAEDVRSAVRRRIVETPGMVSTQSSDTIGASLPVRERVPPKIPEDLKAKIADLRATWTRPDGEELIDAMSVQRCARELACGFHYYWVYPGNPDPLDVEAWFAARKAWNKELREKLKAPQPHLDSPLLLAKAAIRYYAGYKGDLPVWESETWLKWRELRDTIQHETRAKWVSDYLVRDAALWAKDHNGIVWYEHDAFGRAVAKAAGLPLHGGGIDAEAKIRAEKGDQSIVASIKSHSVGRDGLQFLFNEQLVTTPPSDGAAWQQLLGRLHRPGQEADEVVTYVYRHTPEMSEAIDKAINFAKFVVGITGASQKLLCASVEF